MLLDADDFSDDWYGHVTNQAGHAFVVGFGMVILALTVLHPVAAPIVVAAAYFVVWEGLIQPQNKGWADSIEDTAFVMTGASPVAGALWYATDFWPAWWTVAICYAGAMVVLLIGALRRWQP